MPAHRREIIGRTFYFCRIRRAKSPLITNKEIDPHTLHFIRCPLSRTRYSNKDVL